MRNHLYVSFLFLIVMFFAGCQNQLDVNNPVDDSVQKMQKQNTITNGDEQSIECFDNNFEGCVKSVRYWKRHSKYGPGEADPNWGSSPENFYEDSEFFKSGKTYFQVISSNEWWVNPYYTLARQYIALRLNARSGATVPQKVYDAYEKADNYFMTYSPDDIRSRRYFDRLRLDFLHLAKIFAAYNSGFLGPRRCK